MGAYLFGGAPGEKRRLIAGSVDLFWLFSTKAIENVSVLQQFLSSLAGTPFTTPLAHKLGSLCNYRGWRIGPFQHETILSPAVAARECLRPFQLQTVAKKAQANGGADARRAPQVWDITQVTRVRTMPERTMNC